MTRLGFLSFLHWIERLKIFLDIFMYNIQIILCNVFKSLHIFNLVFDSSYRRCIKLFIHTFIDMHSFVFIWLAISRKIWNCMKWWSLDRKVRGKIGTLKIMFTLRDVTPPFCYSGMNEDSYWPSFSHLSHLLPFSLFLTDTEIANKNVAIKNIL